MTIIESVAWYRVRMERLLPESLKDISDAIGFDKVMLIVREYGGQRLWIPKQPTLDWVLLPILDYDAAYKLAKVKSILLGLNLLRMSLLRVSVWAIPMLVSCLR